MKKILFSIIGVIALGLVLYFTAIYYITYSEGYRAGELVKFSSKGYVFKTWEGEISQGVSEAQRFQFSVEDNEKEVIQQLKDLQGKDVKLTYKERFGTFPWLGDTKYFVIGVKITE
ncbi:6-phosphogluconate dehydrogenase [Lutibacter sp. TH_r2]|uniref:6-phosphogluconate dehydrogenase n=1 Tax=Lutibacter sp. TH_r2 TaxID=3082083 RepID=UPI002955B956|nr:6-phosphogluconate dehydrogenase [Lutibacter sp. TH_r2]MDV7186558.1 6-phosphogluconate dehydrogenase [Lutibacter sp. TH_r2]